MASSGFHRIVVGIDFGTTYSALAWANTSIPDNISLIGNWPSAGSKTHHSAPTEISYIDGSTTEYSWGYDIPPNARRLKWFKLLLETDDDDTATKALPLPPGEVTRDYLQALYKHAMSTLYRQNSQAVMAITTVDFVLTVPAVWSEGAKNRTRAAAEAAGITNEHNLQLLSEPEAAAIYSIKMQETAAINVNDRIIVCDAGGGTVDLISYAVLNIVPNLQVTECAVGTGDFCGSTYIDRAFESYLQKRLGSHYHKLRVETQQRIIKNFEEVKCAFEDRVEKPKFYVNVPTVDTIEEAGVFNGELEITRQDMKSLFDPIIDSVIGLLEGQVGAIQLGGFRVNAVLLVGGFGESKYLYKRVRDWASQWGIEVIQPRDAATAVVKGAVLRGLEPSLHPQMNSSVTRMARRNYGTPMSTPFIDHKHDEVDAYMDPVTGQKMARNQVSWFIRKGEALTDTKTITRNFTRSFRKYSGPWVDTMVVCELDIPPTRLTRDVKHLCTVTADLSGIKKSAYEKKWKNFRRFYTARYSLEVQILSGEMQFQLMFQGVPYGSMLVDFDQIEPPVVNYEH